MQAELSPHSIPNFVTASTPMGLRRLMLLNNAKLGGFVKYFDIGQVTLQGRQVFIAWFFAPIQTSTDLDSLLEGPLALGTEVTKAGDK